MTDHLTLRIIRTLFTLTYLFCQFSQAADTRSSHNLFVLDRLDAKTSFVGRANMVTHNGFSDLFFGYADINLRRTIDEHWAFEAGYRHAALELGSGWRQEYRPMFALYWKDRFGIWRFTNRNRIELRYFDGNTGNRVRYRNESVFQSQDKWTPFGLAPFIEDEVFYDLTDNTLSGNWLTLGFSRPWAPGWKWKLGYRLVSQKVGNQWNHRHTLVTGISFISLD